MKDNGVYITGYDDWRETGEKTYYRGSRTQSGFVHEIFYPIG